MRRILTIGLALAIVLATGCGGGSSDDDGQAAEATASTQDETTTSMSPTTSAPTTTSTTSPAEPLPQVSDAALDFMDCDDLVKPGEWWECRRDGGTAYVIEGGGSRQNFVEDARAHPAYDEATSLLFVTTGGYIFVPGFDGFEHVHTTPGELPDMELIDTDQY